MASSNLSAFRFWTGDIGYRAGHQARRVSFSPWCSRSLPFIPYVIGVIQWDWGFNELSATFLVAGFVIALVAGYTLSESAAVFLKAMEGLLAASLFVGVARGISVVLSDGRVMDTIVYGLATSLARAPGPLAALLMIPPRHCCTFHCRR